MPPGMISPSAILPIRPATLPVPSLSPLLWGHSLRERYRDWCRDRLLDRILITLFDDLLQRGQFDPLLALQEKAIIVTLQKNRYRVLSATELQDTWQLSTALVFIQLGISRLRSNK